ncbi:HDOD domain-containing protein [Thioalkalivibrio thiocyanodenitrificans]|uniref:HDOD domain-containing protein n=1 Tax=Thioalkalivibrio thiocyanodenitrificans TaxID=243063 RepID=UPI0003765F81|nr:HDOD domain-containing protein [Thioalkalivibrio thiocyanodenitrificans]
MSVFTQKLKEGNLQLPELPEVARQTLELAQDPRATRAHFLETLEADPAVAERIVQVANPAPESAPAVIEDLEGAVARIGLKLLPHMVIGLVLGRLHNAADPCINRTLAQRWRTSVWRARAARVLSEAYAAHLRPEVAYLSGLVADVGSWPVLIGLEREIAAGEEIEDISGLLEEHSSDVGEFVLSQWGFPEHVLEAVAQHRNPQYESGRTHPDYVDLCIVAHLQVSGVADQDLAHAAAFRKLGLGASAKG